MLVGEGSHPDKVKVYGPGVEKSGLKANEPTYFTVDCSEAGQGGLAGRGRRAFTQPTAESQLSRSFLENRGQKSRSNILHLLTLPQKVV